MSAIYCKNQERGEKPVFPTHQLNSYRDILDDLFKIADSDDYVRDMLIHEKLSSLLILLMEDAWDDFSWISISQASSISRIKREDAWDDAQVQMTESGARHMDQAAASLYG